MRKIISSIQLREDVAGNKAIVYHRTEVENLGELIHKEGIKFGQRTVYGQGFYTTYELKSQLNSYMEESYGKFIYKFGVSSLNNFFLFDYEEFIKTPLYKSIKDSITKYNLSIKNDSSKEPKPEISDTNFIQKQIAHYGITYKKELDEFCDDYFANDSEVEKYCKEKHIPADQE